MDGVTAFLHLYSHSLVSMDNDVLWWQLKKNELFDIRSFYRAILDCPRVSFPWKTVWRSKALRRVCFFVVHCMEHDFNIRQSYASGLFPNQLVFCVSLWGRISVSPSHSLLYGECVVEFCFSLFLGSVGTSKKSDWFTWWLVESAGETLFENLEYGSFMLNVELWRERNSRSFEDRFLWASYWIVSLLLYLIGHALGVLLLVALL